MKHILVEGPDRAGKTMLIQQLLATDLVSWDSAHHGPYPDGKSAFAAYTKSLKYSDTIFDRMFLSEQVYSRVLGRPYMPKGMVKFLSDSLDGLVIFCIPPKEVVLDKWTRDEFISKQQLSTVYDCFELLSTQSFSFETIIYDYTDIASASALDRLIQRRLYERQFMRPKE